MKKVTEIVEKIINEGLTYEAEYSEIEDAIEERPGCFRCTVTLNSAPRDATEFLSESQSEYLDDISTDWMENESSPTDSIIRCGFKLIRNEEGDDSDEDVETYEIFEKFDCQSVIVLLCGDLSCPSYSDDESDAYFSGDVFIQFDGEDWALEESKKILTNGLERSIRNDLSRLVNKAREMRRLEVKDPIAQSELLDLVRNMMLS